MEEVILTQEGYDKLKARLDYLSGQGRVEMAEKIRVAREFGDLSENAEYDAAKNEQAFMEKEIKEISDKLDVAKIVDKSDLDTKNVGVGNTVEILDIEFDEKQKVAIVGSSELHLNVGAISDESPIGRALIGKKKGAIVDVETPGGIVKFQILKILTEK